MEPQLPSPNFSPEQPTYQPKNPDQKLSPSKTSEVLPAQPLEQLRSVETHEQMTGAGVADAAPPSAVTTVPTLVIPTPISDDHTDTVSKSTNPPQAADDDVIEKEWVNKSKKIIAETKGDPYMKEREVSKLQADYLYKRYNKEVKIPDDV